MNREARKMQRLRELVSLTRDILHSEEFRRMKSYRHHIKGTLYEHSVKVAYLCYLHHRRFSLKTDLRELVRGAMLHDYYLYDLHGDGREHRLHWLRHPKTALENARRHYPTLTRAQIDMIERHMFPLTLRPPRTVGGWLVCLYDKLAAISDRFGRCRLGFENARRR